RLRHGPRAGGRVLYFPPRAAPAPRVSGFGRIDLPPPEIAAQPCRRGEAQRHDRHRLAHAPELFERDHLPTLQTTSNGNTPPRRAPRTVGTCEKARPEVVVDVRTVAV